MSTTSELSKCFSLDLYSVTVDFEMIKELILNQSVDVNLALLVVAGLPYSGKSTVMRKVVNATGMYMYMYIYITRL